MDKSDLMDSWFYRSEKTSNRSLTVYFYSDRKSGAWAETASTSGIEIVGYRPVPSYRLALFTGYHPHWLR